LKNSTAIDGDIHVSGASQLDGHTSLFDDCAISGSLSIRTDFAVGSVARTIGDFFEVQSLSVCSVATIGSDTSVGSILDVGEAVFVGGEIAAQNSHLRSSLSVGESIKADGNGAIGGSFTVGKCLQVMDEIRIGSDAILDKSLDVAGDHGIYGS
jgi:NDP-sugar pyrophosphorylase family protein